MTARFPQLAVLLPDSALYEVSWGDWTSTAVPFGERQARRQHLRRVSRKLGHRGGP